MEVMEIAFEESKLTKEACSARVEELHQNIPMGEDVSDTSVLNRYAKCGGF